MIFNQKLCPKRILEKITDVYIFAIILIFPFIVDNTGFFRILECKYRSYVLISVIYIFLVLVTSIFIYIKSETKKFKKIKLSAPQIALVIFWLVNLLAYIFSPYRKEYNLLVGVGRGEGIATITIYCISCFLITVFGKFKKGYLTFFSISCLIELSICLLQYVGFNPLNMYQNGIGTHNVSFMGTIGNIDFISAYLTICLSMSFAEYVFIDGKRWQKIINVLNIILGAFIVGIIGVESGKVAFLLCLTLVFPFIAVKSKRMTKMLELLAAIVAGYCINLIINPKYFYSTGTLEFCFQITPVIVLLIVIVAVLLVLSRVFRCKRFEYDIKLTKKMILCVYLSIFILGLLALAVVYFVDIDIKVVHELHELLHGNINDEYGTYRVFLWRRSLSLIKDYPLIGTGPDTFALRFMPKYYEDIKSIGELTINDTAANVYLTHLVNIGILGVVAYVAFCLFTLIKASKSKNIYIKVMSVSVICFLIQDFFNLWVVIVVPIYWTLVGIVNSDSNE